MRPALLRLRSPAPCSRRYWLGCWTTDICWRPSPVSNPELWSDKCTYVRDLRGDAIDRVCVGGARPEVRIEFAFAGNDLFAGERRLWYRAPCSANPNRFQLIEAGNSCGALLSWVRRLPLRRRDRRYWSRTRSMNWAN